VIALVALLLAQVEFPAPSVPSDVRSQRAWVLSGEAGWNGLAGVGLVIARHMSPRATLEAGVGLSGEGPKFGGRARYNFLVTEWSPFASFGFLYGTGDPNALRETGARHTFSYRIGPSPFLQICGGVEYQSRSGLNFLAALGYAWLLKENLTVVNGAATADDLSGVRLTTGGGVAASISFGYAF
jgi:hypothetical protein